MNVAVADPTLQAMFDELRRADPIYLPSAFWNWYCAKNLEQLDRQGLERFKTSVNQNYYNWVPTDFQDNQLRNLIRYWSDHPSLSPLRARMEGVSAAETVVEQGVFADLSQRELYALFVGLLWHFTAQHDRHGVLDRLAEPEVGDPIRIRLGDKLISQDVANSVRECNAVLDHLPARTEPGRKLRIAELGAGYGRLAYVFAASQPCQYWIFDIPPALHIAQWYLPQVLPGKRVFHFRPFASYASVRAEIETADLCFFTPNQLELMPERSVDAFVSISSLAEMTPEQIRNYLHLIQTRTRDLAYVKQWIRSINPLDQLTIDRDAYALTGDWSVAMDRIDAVQDQFFETVYRRGLHAPPTRRRFSWVRSLLRRGRTLSPSIC